MLAFPLLVLSRCCCMATSTGCKSFPFSASIMYMWLMPQWSAHQPVVVRRIIQKALPALARQVVWYKKVQTIQTAFHLFQSCHSLLTVTHTSTLPTHDFAGLEVWRSRDPDFMFVKYVSADIASLILCRWACLYLGQSRHCWDAHVRVLLMWHLLLNRSCM